MDRKIPWWIPRTRVMRAADLAVAVALVAAGGWLAKTQSHSFWSGPVWVIAALFVMGVAAGVLLVLALAPPGRR